MFNVTALNLSFLSGCSSRRTHESQFLNTMTSCRFRRNDLHRSSFNLLFQLSLYLLSLSNIITQLGHLASKIVNIHASPTINALQECCLAYYIYR